MKRPILTNKKIEWEWIMKKPFSVLRLHLDITANNLIPIKWNVKHKIKYQKFIDNHIYISKDDLSQLQTNFDQKIVKDHAYSARMRKAITLEIDKILLLTSKVKKEDFKKYSNESLIALFDNIYNKLGEFSTCLSVRGPVPIFNSLTKKFIPELDKILKKQDKKSNFQEYFLSLTKPDKESYMIKEIQELSEIAFKISKKPRIKILFLKNASDKIKKSAVIKEIYEHKQKYEWMNCVMFYGSPYSIEHYIGKIRDAILEIEKNKDVDLKIQPKNDKPLEEMILKENFNSPLIKELKEWSFLRTYIKDVLSIAIFNIYPLLEEIAVRNDLTLTDLIYLSFPEILNIFKTRHKVLSQTIAERKVGFGALLVENSIQIFTKDRYCLEEKEKINAHLSALHGQIANLGEIKGKARIINDISKDIDNISQGEIIITHMTTTDYTPILKKVAGIITDEGGLTCHAAIISRELNIPCIIGTKIATKFFKTGDHIILNANKGFAKKLPKYEFGDIII